MRLIFTFLFSFSLIFPLTAQDETGQAPTYTNSIPTKRLNALLGATYLLTTGNLSKDSAFINFLIKHKGFEKSKKNDIRKNWTIFHYKEAGVSIKALKTGFTYNTIDDFVEVIEIMAAPERELPYGCDATMPPKKFKKRMRNMGFRTDASKNKTLYKVLKKEVYVNELVEIAIWFDRGKFSRMVLTADLDKMYKGLLIVK